MNDWIIWNSLLDYITFTAVVFAIVQVTKDIKIIKKFATQYWSILVAFILLILTNLNFDTFRFFDLVIYMINAVFISLTANGTYDFKVNKNNIEK